MTTHKKVTPIQCQEFKGTCVMAACISLGKCKFGPPIGSTTADTATADLVPIKKHEPYKPTVQCHSGLYALGTLGKATIYMGREAAVYAKSPDGTPWALTISLLGSSLFNSPSAQPLVDGNDLAKALFTADIFKADPEAPHMHIDWPDYGVPELDRAWWVNFLLQLVKIEGPVALYCHGGHGRTGTAAAIIAGLSGLSGDKCPVEFVRSIYCKECVESEAQAHYIQNVTGLVVTAKTAFDFLADRGGYMGSGGYTSQYTGRNLPGKTLQEWGDDQDEQPRLELVPDDKEPVLSKNRYKKWAKGRPGAIPIGDLEDQDMVEVDGIIFYWDGITKTFEFWGEGEAGAG